MFVNGKYLCNFQFTGKFARRQRLINNNSDRFANKWTEAFSNSNEKLSNPEHLFGLKLFITSTVCSTEIVTNVNYVSTLFPSR